MGFLFKGVAKKGGPTTASSRRPPAVADTER
jgi:hypothetical protein